MKTGDVYRVDALVEKFLRDLEEAGASYEVLSDWMDLTGTRLFPQAQQQFYAKHLEIYAQEFNYTQTYSLAKEQIRRDFKTFYQNC